MNSLRFHIAFCVLLLVAIFRMKISDGVCGHLTAERGGKSYQHINAGLAYLESAKKKEKNGQYKAAIVDLLKAENEFKLANNRSNLFLVYFRMGNVYADHLRLPAIALDYYRKSAEIYNSLPEKLKTIFREFIAYVYYKKGVLLALRNYDEAVNSLKLSSRIYEELGDLLNVRRCREQLEKIDRLLFSENNRNRDINVRTLLSQLKDHLALTRETNDSAQIFLQMGRLYSHLALDSAFYFLKKATSLYLTSKDWPGLIKVWNTLGFYSFQRGKFKLSYQYFENALNLAKKARLYEQLWFTHFGLALYWRELGNFQKSSDHFVEAIRLIESYYGSISSNYMRTQYLAKIADVYKEYIRLLVDRGELAAAFSMVKKIKARSLLGDAIISEMQSMSSRENQKADYLKEMQHSLADNEGALDILSLHDKLYLWFVSNDTLAFADVPVSKEDLRLRIDGLRESVLHLQPRRFYLAARLIYERIFSSFHRLMDKKKFLYISPSGPFYRFPWAVLYKIFPQMSVCLVPNLDVLLIKRKADKKNRPYSVALLAADRNVPQLDRLQYVHSEIWNISSIFADVHVQLKDKASESDFYGVLGSDIIHLACHAVVDPFDPFSSYLLFYPDSLNDGFLTAEEIQRSNLQARLVVLSACTTALGKYVEGDEVLGLASAFLKAGSSFVVASLWQINDRFSSFFMEKFYQNYKRTLSPILALSETQKFFMTDNTFSAEYQNPYFWCAFAIFGSW
jgi:CHAT domain-containing protein